MPITDHDPEKTRNLLESSNKDTPIRVPCLDEIAFRLDNLNACIADTFLKILEVICSKQ